MIITPTHLDKFFIYDAAGGSYPNFLKSTIHIFYAISNPFILLFYQALSFPYDYDYDWRPSQDVKERNIKINTQSRSESVRIHNNTSRETHLFLSIQYWGQFFVFRSNFKIF